MSRKQKFSGLNWNGVSWLVQFPVDLTIPGQMMVFQEKMKTRGGRQMKTLTKILFGVAMVGVAVACSKELDFSYERQQPIVSITASVDDAAATKAFLDEDLKIEWNEGDAISLLAEGVNAKFTAREEGLRTAFDHAGEIAEQAY